MPPASSSQPIIGVDLRVSQRLLWVGGAYYPLQNVARVYTLTIHPRRKEAVLLFVKRLLLTGMTSAFLYLLARVIEESGGDSTAGLQTLVWLAAITALIYSFTAMLNVLSAPAHFVLAVETTGPSTAVVTSPDPGQLRRLAHQIAHAIDNPGAEFTVQVKTISVSPKHYYFGDNVNMYGGSGNVGMATS